ncbi:MAG: stage III sporulation protein AE [Candidatus Carbobacillus altaicus]|uniref:Stage III sporulation protein AE n=1 Tax=Candidatus Carbonibacillus altaicus TaxID=2163959 RepID=A0A2R6Y3A9_9BACL|nr:stage III sporulation protein AE [Candidatus Carbobacillus altaicus]PTQ57159.1 MAG: Stage III sporulation protein AE [Candidatus Carbobacillus altaicus]
MQIRMAHARICVMFLLVALFWSLFIGSAVLFQPGARVLAVGASGRSMDGSGIGINIETNAGISGGEPVDEAGETRALTDKILQKELDHLDLTDIERSFQEVQQTYQRYLPALRHASVREAIRDPGSFFSWSRLSSGLWQYIFDEVRTLFGLLGTILLLSLFAVLLQQIQNAFEEKNVSRIAQFITFTVLAVLVLNSFYMTANSARETIDALMHFMLALFPILLTLIAAGGALGTVGFFHPFVLFLVNASVVLVNKIVFPLFFLGAFLLLISLFTEYYQLSRLGLLMRRVGVAVLSIFFTIFLGVLSVQGTVVSVTDGVTLRTAKYIVSNVIPVFGRMFSDATETVMGASLLAKNAVGLFGVLMLLTIAIFPAVKVLVVALIYQFASAVLQPLGDNPVTASLEVIGQGLMYIFITLVTVALMFYLTLLILLMASNSAVMYR